ncbi:MAG TPA: hydrolase [Kosmotogaceae bacterium]|nr:hydrolase [Kosmotogaceae bacterium]
MLRWSRLFVILIAVVATLTLSSSITDSDNSVSSQLDTTLSIHHLLGEEFYDLRVTPSNHLSLSLRKISEAVDLFLSTHYSSTDYEQLVIHFIDVGQGDAILIHMPCDSTILVDGGPRSAADNLLAYLFSLEIEKIDTMVATHAHEDHIGGLLAVFESELDVLVTFDSGYEHDSQLYRDFISLAEMYSEIRPAERGLQVGVCSSLVDIEILHPPGPMGDANNSSIVIRLEFEDTAVLLTGDAESQAENSILEFFEPSSIRSDILKIGHHGSRTSTTAAFLDAVNPDVAIIMVGENNSYGHPHEEVIMRLQSREIDIYRTDLHGTIVVTIDHTGFKVDAVPWADAQVRGVDINRASLEELQKITHIGPSRAEEIIAMRPFTDLEELQQVSGIGASRYRDIVDQGLAFVQPLPVIPSYSESLIVRHDSLFLR